MWYCRLVANMFVTLLLLEISAADYASFEDVDDPGPVPERGAGLRVEKEGIHWMDDQEEEAEMPDWAMEKHSASRAVAARHTQGGSRHCRV